MNKNRFFKSVLVIGALTLSVIGNAVTANAGGVLPPKSCKAGKVTKQGGVLPPKLCKTGGVLPPK